MKRIWKPRSETKYGDIKTQLLRSRGVAAGDEQKFLNSRFEDGFDPFLLTDMDKAVARIWQAVEQDEQITIYADYDADAVTAAAVVIRFLRGTGYKKVDYYIPDRFSEGYGVNEEAIRTLADRGTKLIITVDCGTNANSAVTLGKSLGIDFVITDHHQVVSDLPEAVAVVNPHRPDDSYSFKDLTGVGVAFKLVQALVKKSELRTPTSELLPNGWEKWLLDLVAIGTVADCQSLLLENRMFVKWGLYVLSKTRWIGLKELIKAAGLPAGRHGIAAPFGTYNLGFQIAPRINAAGRIEHASLALDLLLTDDGKEAQKLAGKLNELNQERQNLTDQILSEAREQVLLQSERKILFAKGLGWPKGVLGLVAGKLTEEFSRPTLVMGIEASEVTGSARSIAGFNITQAMSYSREHLLRYGGHELAAGFTVTLERVADFERELLLHAEETIAAELLSPVLYYDCEITLADINEEMLELLAQFEPTGIGNPKARFRINNLSADYPAAIGSEGRHLRCYARDKEGRSFGCIGFNLGSRAEKLLKVQSLVDIICEPQWNEWNGQKKIQLKIIDIDLTG